mgnify:CR=1 FL=1
MSGTMNKSKDKATFFQQVHVWPLSSSINYEGWLSNFQTTEDKHIAECILDFFTYFPSAMVDKMLRNTVGQAGYYLSQRFPNWRHSDFMNRCYYSFIPGEHPHPTDSGHIFVRKLRDVIGISEDRIIDYAELHTLLLNSKEPLPVLLVDDFIGTGNQCVKAWSVTMQASSGKTLEMISKQGGHAFAYVSLIANKSGYQRIANSCSALQLCSAHVLGVEYNLFNKECLCWQSDEDLYTKGTELILRKSKEIGVPDNAGANELDARGFGMQGLALAFEHGAPDAIPGFFYFCDHDWIPLIKKRYKR